MVWLPFVSACLVLRDGTKRCSTDSSRQQEWQRGNGRHVFDAFGKDGLQLELGAYLDANLEIEALSADTDLAVKQPRPRARKPRPR